ncbi:MAG: YjbF family lipoprotein [Idiomarina sp.]|nr:YjbF family lipoprotein [Idiomarina sp.]
MFKISLRTLVAGCVVASLSACTAVFTDVVSTWQYAIKKDEDVSLSPEQITQFPYTAIYVRQGDAARALVVLGFIDGPETDQQSGEAYYNWISADRETLVTQQGRIVQTSNLSADLLARTEQEADPLRCIADTLAHAGFAGLDAHDCDSDWRYTMDIDSEGGQFSVDTRSEFTVATREVLSLPQAEVEVIKITEHVEFARSRAGRIQTVENQFWLEQDGHVVKSIQHIAPHQAPFTLTQVKWVGRDYE